MENTPNYNMNLPDYEDFADVEKLNENFEIIDAQMKSTEDALTTHLDNTKMFATAKLPANQSSVNNSETYLTLSSVIHNNGADFLEWDSASNKLKITKSGIYEIILNVHFASNENGYRYIQPHSFGFAITQNPVTGATPTRMQALYRGAITANTLLELTVQQSSGGALDILSISNVIIMKVADLS
ncbi:hypothetical protein [Metasolibacillus sp.]|uniref:hypothetical protein n=1 Tax=Metasolibacillus sp. TaxID=2703680 RepID=UPI0025E68DB5|nr:hypothetical protein [Metasolibacillus sp.]MCT6924112.1 hypothetical protein [Metasolibacillus sp.]MCT6940219.1 hypothetical protein [Metasolibacillus sp.]